MKNKETAINPASEPEFSEEFIMDTEAAHNAAVMAADSEMLRELEAREARTQEEREELIAEASRLTGRVEAFNLASKFLNCSEFVTLKKIKDEKIYKYIKGINTWEEYCKSIGFSVDKIDLDLKNLNTFGEDFLRTVQSFGFGYRELRNLTKQVKSGTLEVKEAEVIIDGEAISLDEKDQLKEALTDLILKNQEEKKLFKAEMKAKDKTIQTYADAAEKAKMDAAKAQELSEHYKDKLDTVYHGRLGDVPANNLPNFTGIPSISFAVLSSSSHGLYTLYISVSGNLSLISLPKYSKTPAFAIRLSLITK